MKQSNRLISERRVRAAIFAAYEAHNSDNKPREVSGEVINALDSAIERMIIELVLHEDTSSGRLNKNGYFNIQYLP